MSPSLGSLYLQEWFVELRETFNYQITRLLSKDITQEQPDSRDVEGKICGKGGDLPGPLLEPFPKSPRVHQPRRLSGTSPFGFYGSFITWA